VIPCTLAIDDECVLVLEDSERSGVPAL
jgi:hypothetical protein